MAQSYEKLNTDDAEYNQLDTVYEECLNYLHSVKSKYHQLRSNDGCQFSDEPSVANKGDLEEENDDAEDLFGSSDKSVIELVEFFNKECVNYEEKYLDGKILEKERKHEIIEMYNDATKISDVEKRLNKIKSETRVNLSSGSKETGSNTVNGQQQNEDAIIEILDNTIRVCDLEDKLNKIKDEKECDTASNLNDAKSNEVLITISDQSEEASKNDASVSVGTANEAINDEIEPTFKIENEKHEIKSERLRRLSEQLPKIIITQSNTSLDEKQVKNSKEDVVPIYDVNKNHVAGKFDNTSRSSSSRYRSPYIEYPRRLVSKHGVENVALISNVPYGKLRLLNDTFHTLINLRWRWIVTGTVIVHFTIWLVFAIFWYIASLAHYDFEPDPPQKACITGGKDFVTIFLASVEAQTTIGFGDRTIDEECPESIFLFIMQLILGTGLSGVLTCVVYAKLTRPEKLSRDGVGFSKKAVICMRDGKLCLMLRAWDLNYDHLITSDFSAHFVKTYRTKEGEYIRYYARSLDLQQRQFLLWPVTIVHVIDENSPLYNMTPEDFINYSYEITISLKGASASMGTYTQSQTSYLPREVLWGYRFPSVVKYDHRKRKYVIEGKKTGQNRASGHPIVQRQSAVQFCIREGRHYSLVSGHAEQLQREDIGI